jgi:hypothetical protein
VGKAMDPIVITLDQLRGMIGLRLLHQGMACVVVEVLEDGPSLVLEAEETPIQGDMHGRAHRRVPETRVVPVLTADQSELHSEFLSLELM